MKAGTADIATKLQLNYHKNPKNQVDEDFLNWNVSVFLVGSFKDNILQSINTLYVQFLYTLVAAQFFNGAHNHCVYSSTVKKTDVKIS
ncbi:hypothetical protein P879_06279 [Paragonimus westermani]|uniref:Uncharacterized protein n=1 Tax=Paragonimus westermani TaxID=34504 RepID=A0A8T0DMJ6_9TREM|nr:hypothetical protein P879_06279 [Paragonimus westermani]